MTLALMKERLSSPPSTFDEETLGEIFEMTPLNLIKFFFGWAQAYGTEEDRALAERALHPVSTEEETVDPVVDMMSPAVALQDLDVPDEGIADQAEVTLSNRLGSWLERRLHWIATNVVEDMPESFKFDDRGNYLVPLTRQGVVFELRVSPQRWHTHSKENYLSNGWSVI